MTYRSAFMLPAAICGPANALAVQIGVDPQALHNTLSVPLVPTDGPADATPTHFACCGILTDSQRHALESASSQFSGALWFRWEEGSGKLAASYDGLTLGQPWSWEKSLEVSNLKRKTSFLV